MKKIEYIKIVLHSCILFFVFSILIGLYQFNIYKKDVEFQSSLIDRNISLMQLRVSTYLERMMNDADFLAQSSSIKKYLKNPSPESLEDAQKFLLLIASQRPDLDQVRYLDEQGIERIRLDQRKGVLQVASKLQDKSDRDYVREGLALEGGDIYFSEVDLNIEYGVIEKPYQPMLRVVTRLMMDGQKSGLIVLNARIENLGRRLQMILGESHKLVVINHDGGWIVGGAEKDWKFVLAPNDSNSYLSKIDPSLWEKIQNSYSGRFEYQGDCYDYRWYHLNLMSVKSPSWLIAQKSVGESCAYQEVKAWKTWALYLIFALFFALPFLWLWHVSQSRARRLQQELHDSHTQLELVTQEADLGLLMVDYACRVCWINPEAQRILGWSASEILGKNLHELAHLGASGESVHRGPCPTLRALETGKRYRNDSDKLLSKRGDLLHVSLRVSPYGEGADRKAIITIADVSEFVANQERLTELASIDELTGVLNRRSILDQLRHLIDIPGGRICVVMADIDFFKRINDNYGHAVGDQVLKNFTETLRGQLRQGDWLGRIGGEEFVIVLANAILETAKNLAERLRIAVSEQACCIEDNRITVTASFGLAMFDGQESLDQLLERADEALYRAKRSGRNRVEVF